MAAASQALAYEEFADLAPLAPIEIHTGELDKLCAVRILLLDEQAHVLRVMRLSLERVGFNVTTVSDVNAALALLLQQACDMLIVSSDCADSYAKSICDDAASKLGVKSPLILFRESQSYVLEQHYPFVRLLKVPFSQRAIVDCLRTNESKESC